MASAVNCKCYLYDTNILSKTEIISYITNTLSYMAFLCFISKYSHMATKITKEKSRKGINFYSITF